jgi:PAS domain S-box-containing protein
MGKNGHQEKNCESPESIISDPADSRTSAEQSREAIETLKESQKEYRSILENITDGYFELDLEGNLTVINKSLCEISGYSRDELIGMNYREFLAEDMAEKAFEIYNRVFQTGKPVKGFESEIIIKTDRSKKPVEVSISPILDSSGEPSGFRGVLRDISDRKKVEEIFRESEEKYRMVLEANPEPVAVYDMNGKVVYFNPAFTRIFGWSLEEMIGKKLDFFVPEENWPETRMMINKVRAGERFSGIESCRYTNEGRKIPVSISGAFIRDKEGNIINSIINLRDITDRKDAEKSLNDAHRTLLTVLDSIDATIYVADLKTHEVLFLNQRMKNLFGENAIGKKCHSVFRNETRECVHCTNDRLLDALGNPTGVHVWEGQNPITKRWYVNYDRAVQWIDGRLVRLQIATDITHIKELEKKRMETEEQLRQVRKMEAVGTLAGGIAHDFNNILSIILGNSELALIDIQEWNPARQNLEAIRKACLRAKDVVRQLLSFGRKTEVMKKPIRLDQIVGESLNLIRASIPAVIEIRHRFEEGIDPILGDPTQINQILINLCANAADAMSAQGGVLEILIKGVEIKNAGEMMSLAPGRYVQLTVTDSGIGIPEEMIENIFDPYFTTKETGRGTGLGLAVVDGIVKAHDGFITVSSVVGQGTSFTIFFPAVNLTPIEEKESNAALPKGHERILFVDDEPFIVSAASQMLTHLGYSVETDTDPQAALERIRANPNQFDLVVTDMTMPKLTGDQLACEILKIRPQLPVILCTGYTRLLSEEQARRLGIREYVLKPVDMKHLARIVRSTLDGCNKRFGS